jgi:hypothetical protein
MAKQLTIELPKDTPREDVDSIQAELTQLSGVKGTGVYTPKGLIIDDIWLWVKLSEVVVPLVLKIADALRKRRIEKATIVLPNGAKLEADKATAEEIQRLMLATGTTAPKSS